MGWFICCKARLGFVAEPCEHGNRNLVQSNGNCLNRRGAIRVSRRAIFHAVNYNIIIIIIIIIIITDRYIKNWTHFNFSLDWY